MDDATDWFESDEEVVDSLDSMSEETGEDAAEWWESVLTEDMADNEMADFWSEVEASAEEWWAWTDGMCMGDH